jgi:hypothetical protein
MKNKAEPPPMEMKKRARIIIDGHEHISLDGVKFEKPIPARGLGRWIYCKYCYESVRPLLGGINQIVCPKCGSGLSPDFFRRANLTAWLKGIDRLSEDRESPEAKLFVASMRRASRAENN